MAKVLQVDTILQRNTMQHLQLQCIILQSLYRSTTQSIILTANSPFLIQSEVRIPSEWQNYCKLIQCTYPMGNAPSVFAYNPEDNKDRKDKTVLGKILRECILCFVPGETLRKGNGLVKLIGLQNVPIFVHLQLTFGNLQHFHNNVGTVISGSSSTKP